MNYVWMSRENMDFSVCLPSAGIVFFGVRCGDVGGAGSKIDDLKVGFICNSSRLSYCDAKFA